MGPHVHNFRVLNQSQERAGNGLKWMDRCRCGATVMNEASYSLGRREPSYTKHWYDREGHLLKVTGNTIAVNGGTQSERPSSQGNSDQP